MDNEILNYEVTQLGKIRIAPLVIEILAKLSTLEIDGVVDLSGGFTGEIREFLGRNKNVAKGIKVELGEKDVTIDVSVIIKYGFTILDVAERIQENIKDTIESITGLHVTEVNVHINGIQFEEDVEHEGKLK